jgi:hypothetical protein
MAIEIFTDVFEAKENTKEGSREVFPNYICDIE